MGQGNVIGRGIILIFVVSRETVFLVNHSRTVPSYKPLSDFRDLG